MKKRYLTKSRFKIGSDCATKLYYTKKDKYANTQMDDPFLAALANGGAALTTYGVMQFYKMSAIEREALSSALLKYCELDTLAMVMIYEGWREII